MTVRRLPHIATPRLVEQPSDTELSNIERTFHWALLRHAERVSAVRVRNRRFAELESRKEPSA